MPNLWIKTPLWTGNLDMKSDVLQPTGIMGSLRWWFEAILRGLDKYACDPTSGERCPVNLNKKDHFCPACLIFGATGIRRMFGLDVDGGEKVFDEGPVNIKPLEGHRGWYLGSGLKGKMKLRITALDKDFEENLILTPLIVASKWGGIGGKTQHGYGVVEIEDVPEIDVVQFKGALEKIVLERPSKLNIELRHGNVSELPNLKEMFFAKVRFEVDNKDWWQNVDGLSSLINDGRIKDWVKEGSGSVPIAPAIKYWLRFKDGSKLWKTNDQNKNGKIENYLFGTMKRTCARCYCKVRYENNSRNLWCPSCRRSLRKGDTLERIGSKVNVSCAYKVGENLWEFRIWGWIPKDGLPEGFNREGFLNNLKQSLEGLGSALIPWDKLLGSHTKNHQLKVWREFASSRDTEKPEENNVEEYLQSLLNGKGDENDP